MMTRTLTFCALACALGLAGLGCNGDDDTCDGGNCSDGGKDAGKADAGPMLWGLSRDKNDFDVKSIAGAKDDCGIDVASLVGKTLPVTYNATSHEVSIGDPQGSPVMPSLGSGVVSNNKATLTRENETGDTGCTWHQKDVSHLTLTNHDQFTLEVTEDESEFASGCDSADVPKGGKCTSTWTWTLAKVK